MKHFTLATICSLLTLTVCRGDIAGSTDTTKFQDSVDWCKLGCAGAPIPTPTVWVSARGNGGSIGYLSLSSEDGAEVYVFSSANALNSKPTG